MNAILVEELSRDFDDLRAVDAISFSVKPGEIFTLMRFVGWGAGHDIGRSGLTTQNKIRAVEELSAIPLEDDVEPAAHGVPYPPEISSPVRVSA